MEVEKENLILAYQPLAYKLGDMMWSKYLKFHYLMEKEDCLAEAVLSLVRAAEKFDPRSGKTFSSYLYSSLKNHFIDLSRLKWIEQFCEIPLKELEQQFSVEEGESAFENLFGEEDGMLEMVELLEELARFLQTCSERERALVRLLSQGYSQKECAQKLVEEQQMKSCSQPMISNMVKKLVEGFRFRLYSVPSV